MPIPTTIAAQLQDMFPTGNIASSLGGSSTSRSPLQTRQTFFDFLGQWETAIPLQELWAVIFKIPRKVSTKTMNKWGEYIGPAAGPSVDKARGKLLNGAGYPSHAKGSNDLLGCLFAQTIGIPVEQSMISTVGPSNRGFIKGPIMEQRQTFAPLNIEFLETNVSFNEFILRPWTIICQHEGLVARNSRVNPGEHDPNTRVTTDITIINFGKTSGDPRGPGMIPRKIWYFTDCFPVNIGPERYSYGPTNELDRRDTEWNFRRYQVILPDGYLGQMDQIHKRPPAPAPVASASVTPAPFKTAKDSDYTESGMPTGRL